MVWLVEDGVPRCTPLPGSNLVPFERYSSTQEAANTVAESLVALYRVDTHRFGEGGGQLDCRRVRGGLNPCARESKTRIGRFLREKLMSDHGRFSSMRATRSGERARFVGLFQGFTGLRTAGCWLARRLYQLKAALYTIVPRSPFFSFCTPKYFRLQECG